jgi:two-component system sensor histidine kinase UhpB
MESILTDEIKQISSIAEAGTLKVLLLEDMFTDAELIKLELRQLDRDFDVLHVSNEEEFKKELDSFDPHLVISDYSLPQFTGMEALHYVRATRPYIPFIMCTGRVNEETAVECIKAGADDYVLKDSLGRLTSCITSAIDNKRNLLEKELATANLQKSEENFRALAENAPDNIYKISRDGTILYINRSEGDMAHGENVGASIFNYVNESDHDKLKLTIETAWTEMQSQTIELEGNPALDDISWYRCRIGPVLKDDQVESLVFIPSNITDKKLAETELKELNSRLQHLTRHLENIRDEEKQRISMEIHDQLGQELTGFKLGLFYIQQKAQQQESHTEEEKEILNKVAELIDLNTQTIQTVRRIAHELRPVVLDNMGLIPAVEWHVENFNKSHTTQCHLSVDVGDEHFDNELSTAIYRITQETLTNIHRHAQADNAYINLHCVNHQLTLEIKDDGVGIDVEKAFKSKSLGLFGIRERIKNWNGDLDIQGEPGKGTTIRITIELEKLKT